MSEDDGSAGRALATAEEALEVAREARSDAREAQSTAERALDTARDAQGTADEALREVHALQNRVGTLEGYVEALIRMLEEGIRTLVERTEAVERSVEAQGTAIQERVDHNTQKLEEGFMSVVRQEVEARLLESSSALKGLESRLIMVKGALQGEFDQARRRGDEQKARFAVACRRTVDSLNRDIARLGSLVLQIKERDFGGTVERRVEALRAAPDTFEMAREVGQVNLKERAMAMAPHLGKLDMDLAGFAAGREGIIAKLQPFVHADLHLPTGDYALPVYFADGNGRSECVVAADVSVKDRTVQFQKVSNGLGRFETPFLALWNKAKMGPGRPIAADERARVQRYLDQLHAAGALTDGELTVIRQHVAQTPIDIRNPSVESQR